MQFYILLTLIAIMYGLFFGYRKYITKSMNELWNEVVSNKTNLTPELAKIKEKIESETDYRQLSDIEICRQLDSLADSLGYQRIDYRSTAKFQAVFKKKGKP